MFLDMKDKIIGFFKNGFNIALIALQMVAIICYFLCEYSTFLVVIFFALEGAFFVVWGTKILVNNRDIDIKSEIYHQLPFSGDERINISKRNENIRKNNKFIAISLIIFGIVLVFGWFTMLF